MQVRVCQMVTAMNLSRPSLAYAYTYIRQDSLLRKLSVVLSVHCVFPAPNGQGWMDMRPPVTALKKIAQSQMAWEKSKVELTGSGVSWRAVDSVRLATTAAAHCSRRCELGE